MRVIGGHDFYDSAQAFGQDREMVFVRTPWEKVEGLRQSECGLAPVDMARVKMQPENGSRYAEREKLDNRHGRFNFAPRVVWFAGKRHACVKVDGYRKERGGEHPFNWHAWTAEELKSFLASVGVELAESPWGDRGLSVENVDEWFSSEGKKSEVDWLIENRVSIAISDCPVFEWGYSQWKEGRVWKIDTDGLKDMGFARVVPPWDAFQQLSMWIGGTLAHPGRPTVSIESDVVRRDKHGFDGMSFKKPKASIG